jgi:hypothetical protein
MKSSNHSSLDNIKPLYDDTLENDKLTTPNVDPFLDQPNNETNEFWNKDYRGLLLICGGTGTPSYTTISIKNGDGTTGNFKFVENIPQFIYLPLHVRITEVDKSNSFEICQIYGLK